MRKLVSVSLVTALSMAAAASEKWELVPLGEPGSLKVATELKNEPRLADRPPLRREGIVLVDEGRTPVVAANLKNRLLAQFAEEIRWHLAEMSGRDVTLADERKAAASAAAPLVRIAELDVPSQTAVLKIDGDAVTIGGDGTGISHAMTYFLESLGCRYLWPGPTGKVIPKRKRVVLPDVSLNAPPAFEYIRRIWAPSGRGGRAPGIFKFLKMDQAAFCRRYDEARIDRKGNRSYYVWHGFNDRLACRTRKTKPTLQDAFSGGHYFDHYYAKYSKEHPDWFALQPNGTRVNRSPHPRLCLSNEGLIQEVIRDRIDYFRRNPDEPSASVCLPDGHRDAACMCEGCRRLDPVNAQPIRWGYYNPDRIATNYVALTDRVLYFCNRIAEGVTAVYPGKKLKTFIYSSYVRPPVKIKPHPALVLFNVEGNLTEKSRIGREVSGIAAFAAFGNPLVWRPNILHGFQAQVPQNYARILYDDTVRFKVNNVRGVSFDCCSGEFALRGFIFYMLGRALFNHDNLSYEAQLDDFCACFGKGAPMVRRYLDELERIHMRAAERARGTEGLLEDYPVAELSRMLDRADALTSAEPEANVRVKFLKKGLDVAREEIKLYKAWYTTEWKPLLAARKKYIEFVRNLSMDDPVALCPLSLGFKGPYLRGTPRRTPEQRAAFEAKRAAKRARALKDGRQPSGYTDGEGNFVEQPK